MESDFDYNCHGRLNCTSKKGRRMLARIHSSSKDRSSKSFVKANSSLACIVVCLSMRSTLIFLAGTTMVTLGCVLMTSAQQQQHQPLPLYHDNQRAERRSPLDEDPGVAERLVAWAHDTGQSTYGTRKSPIASNHVADQQQPTTSSPEMPETGETSTNPNTASNLTVDVVTQLQESRQQSSQSQSSPSLSSSVDSVPMSAPKMTTFERPPFELIEQKSHQQYLHTPPILGPSYHLPSHIAGAVLSGPAPETSPSPHFNLPLAMQPIAEPLLFPMPMRLMSNFHVDPMSMFPSPLDHLGTSLVLMPSDEQHHQFKSSRNHSLIRRIKSLMDSNSHSSRTPQSTTTGHPHTMKDPMSLAASDVMPIAKSRGAMWDLATDTTLGTTLFHMLETASLALPLGFMLMPFVRAARSPRPSLGLARLLPARASHRSVNYEDLARRLELLDKFLSRATISTSSTHQHRAKRTR